MDLTLHKRTNEWVLENTESKKVSRNQ